LFQEYAASIPTASGVRAACTLKKAIRSMITWGRFSANAIFSQRDFQPGNEKRLEEKLLTVMENEERFRQYETQHPGKEYFLVDAMNHCWQPVIPEETRKSRGSELIAEIKEKLATKPAPEQPLPQEEMMLGFLAKLPPKAQQWLFDNNYEIAFSAEKKIDASGREYYSYDDMLATNPVARQHSGGGALTSFRPFDADAIKYVWSTLGRDPVALLAHEALGHGLFKAAFPMRGEDTILQLCESATQSDLGDVNKIKEYNPTPNNGRLGMLMEILAGAKNEETLLSSLRAFDADRVPVFQTDADAQQWLADVKMLAQDTWPKLGPDSWTYTQECYCLPDGGYNRPQTLNEIGAIVGEQYFSVAQGKEKALAFVIPALVDFWEKEMLPQLEQGKKPAHAQNWVEYVGGLVESLNIPWTASLGETSGRRI